MGLLRLTLFLLVWTRAVAWVGRSTARAHAPRQMTAMTAAAATPGVAAILLAGGVGSRMKADRPKQFLELEGKPVLMHSLDLFLSLDGIDT